MSDVRMTSSDTSKLGLTALFTSQAWIEGGIPEAWLFDTRQGRAMFWAVTGAYELARRLRPGIAPILAGLLHRHLMIDHLLRESRPEQTVELAAGLSARGARFSAEGMRYLEVDLPPVVAAKRRLLRRTAHGREVAARPNLQLVAGDVTRLDLGSLLAGSRRTVVIAEGLHMYLEVATQRRLWRGVAQALGRSGGGVFIFDHFRPTRSHGANPLGGAAARAMRAWRQRVGFRTDRRSRRALARDLSAAGFQKVESFHSREMARRWGLLMPNAPTDTLVLCAHVEGRCR